MLRPLIVVTLALAIAPALAAQEKPSPAVQKAITATWQFDQTHSDTVTGNPLAGASGGLRPITGGSGGGAAAAAGVGAGAGGGGGGGGRGGRGGGGGGSPQPSPAQALVPGDQGVKRAENRDPHLQILLDDVDPGASLALGAGDSLVTIATAAMTKAGTQSTWKTDGKKHQDAQMDGTIVETQAMWRDGVLTTLTNVVGVGSLKREFEVSKDAQTLKVKLNIEASGRKAEKKLTFTRKQ